MKQRWFNWTTRSSDSYNFHWLSLCDFRVQKSDFFGSLCGEKNSPAAEQTALKSIENRSAFEAPWFTKTFYWNETNNFLLYLSAVLCYICLTIWLTYRWNNCSMPASKLLSIVIVNFQWPWMAINHVIRVLKLVIFTGKNTVTHCQAKTTLNSISCFHRRK